MFFVKCTVKWFQISLKSAFSEITVLWFLPFSKLLQLVCIFKESNNFILFSKIFQMANIKNFRAFWTEKLSQESHKNVVYPQNVYLLIIIGLMKWLVLGNIYSIVLSLKKSENVFKIISRVPTYFWLKYEVKYKLLYMLCEVTITLYFKGYS